MSIQLGRNIKADAMDSPLIFASKNAEAYLCIRSLALFDTSTSDGKLNFP